MPKYKNDTSSSNSTGANSGSTALSFKVGDEVQFTGTSHYTSANATSYKTSPAKVTAISKGQSTRTISYTPTAPPAFTAGWTPTR